MVCPGCGYDLGGVETGRCPECGRGVGGDEAARAGHRAAEGWRAVRGTVRAAGWLWAGMVPAVPVLWLFDGRGVAEWLSVGVVSACGVLAATGQAQWLRGAAAGPNAGRGPGRACVLLANAHLAAAGLVALPVLGVSFLLLVGAAVSALAPG